MKLGILLLASVGLLSPFIAYSLDGKTQHREIALTFDDCPRKTGTLMRGMERAKKLIDELSNAGVPQVAFFCNSPTRAADGLQRLRYFADHGHLIANHSATHLDLYKASPEEFMKDVDRADKELRDLPNFRKWFRFPYLHEGKTASDVVAVRALLTKAGYVNGYVTVDNNDWYIDDLLSEAVAAGKKYDQTKLCSTYARIMTDEAEFFDNMSVSALGHSVRHVILLHETNLNALCIGELVKNLRTRDWSIISPELAYKDPIALREPSASVKMNQGRVFALAQESGYKGPYYSRWNEEEDIKKEFIQLKIWE